MNFPGGKQFAFTVLDDTDDSTLANVKPVYDHLVQCGMRTTKTAWAVDCPEGSKHFFAAETLQNEEYRKFVVELHGQGFEIASHGATMESSDRRRTIRALERLEDIFGNYPRLFCNHGQNRDNLYWGHKRFQTPILKNLFRFVKRENQAYYMGDTEGSEWFWGDLAKAHIRYVRNLTFRGLDMMQINPEMPYRRADTPYVNLWFSTTDAPDVESFNRTVTEEGILKLERSGGVCIVSTHFGKGFVKDGRLNRRTAEILTFIAGRPGWFVPVSDLLDFLSARPPAGQELSRTRQALLEARFLYERVLSR